MDKINVDLKIRSWTKSFTWRTLGVIILLPLVYIATGKLESAAIVTLEFHAIRIVLYYFHERIWEKISWGRGNNNDVIWFYLSLTILLVSFGAVIFLSIYNGRSN